MMTIPDVPPPNTPRVLQDGQLEIGAMTVPVLISGNQRLIVLSSECIHRMEPGQSGTLIPNGREPQPVIIGDIDHLSLIVRYEPT
ncbi:MAG: hypothetical protein KatS3mg057_1916 [Herpetosiphonaceae bacterium]|nr:MAG: hypothetical protein KatS3mg057_1916 [Herpetosiphonaceae bacterium]